MFSGRYSRSKDIDNNKNQKIINLLSRKINLFFKKEIELPKTNAPNNKKLHK